MTETLACFLPDRAKDLSALLYIQHILDQITDPSTRQHIRVELHVLSHWTALPLFVSAYTYELIMCV